ncbi:reverse transcriptase domain-containing protein [Tanacetum coccineum]
MVSLSLLGIAVFELLLITEIQDLLGFCFSNCTTGRYSVTGVSLGYGKGFFESKKEWGGIGVKEKNKDSDNVAAKDVIIPPVVDEPVVTVSGNSNGTQDVNVVFSIDTLGEGIVTDSPSDPNKSGPKLDTSYANLFTSESSRKSVNFRTLITQEHLGKYGLVKSMLNSSTGLFFFQFSSMDGLDSLLENGPWFISNNSLILKKWNSDVNLLKEDVSNISVWVKLYGVPVTAFSEDGLSTIAIKLGTPLMLDSYTSDMCMQS